MLINIAEALAGSVQDVTKAWAKQRKAEERDHSARLRRRDSLLRARQVSIRDAAWMFMNRAYRAASDGGALPTRPRQIMYAARLAILARTDKKSLDDRYFTQTLLPDFMEENPEICEAWDIVWDARGHFTEPHTARETALGTLEVRDYLGLRATRGDVVSTNTDPLYPSHGPEHRYRVVLFIEKEGFGPLFKTAQLAERFDLAIMSTKGMSVTAARMLLDHLVERGVEQIFVLHDFDVSGFSILGTLGTDSRRYVFGNDLPIVDLGLRLNDVQDMELQSEPVDISGDWYARARTLERHGATPEEIYFLENARVELNAMTSRQMIDFIEKKLIDHGVEKLVPDDGVLAEHARRLLAQQYATEAIAPLRAGIAERVSNAELPPDLAQRVAEKLEESPALPWDRALAEVLDEAG